MSTNYRELLPAEVPAIAAELAAAWQDPGIPERQYAIVKPELENYRKGGKCAPFDAFVRCMERLPEEMRWPATRLLDLGASGAFYKEILQQNSFWCDYTACDYNPAFKVLAEELYPLVKFDVADARHLPYHDDSFNISISGGLIMHSIEYEQIIAEMARVTSEFIILHRTPVLTRKPTTFYVKTAYGVDVLEVHFNEDELLSLFRNQGLSLVWTDEVFFNFSESFGHRNYVLRKPDGLPHHSV